MKSFIKNCDFISPEITLYFKGENHHSSFFSGITSIILFVLAFLLSIFFSMDLLFKRNPTMFSYIQTIHDTITFPLNSTLFFHYISIYNKINKTNLYNKSHFSVIGVQSSSTNTNLYLNNSNEEFSHWIYEECDQKEYGEDYSYIFRGEKNKYKNVNYNNGLCIKKYYNKDKKKIIYKNEVEFIYPNIQNADDSVNSYYFILLRDCINNTKINNNNCVSKGSFVDLLEIEPIIYLSFFSGEIQLKNYKEPVIYDIKNISITFDDESYIIINRLIFNPITIITNEGYIFDNNKKQYATSYESSYLSYKLITSYNYLKASFILSSSKNNKIYERTYKKIQDVAGAVDGFTEILIILIEFINCFIFHDFQVIEDYTNIIYGHVKRYKLAQKYTIARAHSQYLNVEDDSNTSKFYNKKKVKFNTFMNYVNDNSNIHSTLTLKSNISVSKLPNTFQKKLSIKYHKFGWFEFLVNRFNKGSPYINYLINERKRMFSEERFFSNYEAINNVKEYIKKINNNNNIMFSLNKNNNRK